MPLVQQVTVHREHAVTDLMPSKPELVCMPRPQDVWCTLEGLLGLPEVVQVILTQVGVVSYIQSREDAIDSCHTIYKLLYAASKLQGVSYLNVPADEEDGVTGLCCLGFDNDQNRNRSRSCVLVLVTKKAIF